MRVVSVARLTGSVLKFLSLCMLAPVIVALVYGARETAPAFLASAALTGAAGFLLALPKTDERVRIRDAYAAAAFSWIAVSFFGALPFFFAGVLPHFTDCLFESVSGFTTTGVSVCLAPAFLPRSVRFWRAQTQLIGGLGILLCLIAIMPTADVSALHLLRAEQPGPSADKVSPKIQDTARVIFTVYFFITVISVLLLRLCGLDWFSSLLFSFTTASTGGFAHFETFTEFGNAAAQVVLTVQMFLSGCNFALYFFIFNRKITSFFKDEEFRLYAFVCVCSVFLIAVNVFITHGLTTHTLGQTVFNTVSHITTTGAFDAPVEPYPAFSRFLFILLMFCGPCASSTGGGVKLVRVILIFKSVKIEIGKILHPKSVKTLALNGKAVDAETVSRTYVFFFISLFTFALLFVPLCIQTNSLETSFYIAAGVITNTGSGIYPIDFTHCGKAVKYAAQLAMIAARLEFIPFIVLFARK